VYLASDEKKTCQLFVGVDGANSGGSWTFFFLHNPFVLVVMRSLKRDDSYLLFG